MIIRIAAARRPASQKKAIAVWFLGALFAGLLTQQLYMWPAAVLAALRWLTTR